MAIAFKKNNCACYRQVNPIFQSNLTFITIVNRPIGIDLQFDWTRKTATTKYKAKEIEEKETKALHLCTSRDSFATMVKIYGIPQLFEWTMNSSPFFMAQWFFHPPVCSLITYNSLGLNWLKIANTHKNESFHYCEYGWVRFFVATQNRLGLHYARWKMKNISAKKMGKEKRIQIISDVSQVQPNFFYARNTLPTQSSFFILSFSFNRNKNGVRIMTWHFLYLYFVVFNIGFLFFSLMTEK